MGAEQPPLVETTTVGGVRVLALLDCTTDTFMSVREAFPDATDDDLARARLIDPTVPTGPVATAAWRLAVRAYLIEVSDDERLLVDTGGAGTGPLAADWLPDTGRFHDALAAAGWAPTDVTDVVLTHVHRDHVANVLDETGASTFSEAWHHVQRVEVALDRLIGTAADDLLSGLNPLQVVRHDGHVPLMSNGRVGIRLLHTPGHTPGHQSVLVQDDDTAVLVGGDVFVHAAQVVRPDLAYVHEEDPAAAAATRRALLTGLEPLSAVLASAHLGPAFLRLG